jgi:hypothetical protein
VNYYIKNIPAVLFTIVKIWSRPRLPSVDEWIKQYLQDRIPFGHKKNEFVSWVELEITIVSKQSGQGQPNTMCSQLWKSVSTL